MASAFDDLATKIPKGEMGSRDPSFVTDFLGRQAPLSFSGQPALPSAGSPTPSAGPSGPSGTGAVGEKGATGLLATPGGATPDLSGSVAGAGGGGGSEGPSGPGVGEGGGSLPSFSGQLGGVNISASPFGASAILGGRPGLGVSASPAGRVGFTTGNPAIDQALSFISSTVGIPLGVNVGSALAGLIGGPIGGIISSLVGPAAAPIALVSLAHQIALGLPQSVTNLQAAIQSLNPEQQLTQQQANMIATYGARAFSGPAVGGPQSATGLATDAPALGPQGAAFGLDFSNPSVRSGFEANQPSTARTDVGVPSATTEGPGISGAPPGGAIGAGAPGAGLGEGGPGGPGPGAPSDGGATGGGTDAGEA